MYNIYDPVGAIEYGEAVVDRTDFMFPLCLD